MQGTENAINNAAQEDIRSIDLVNVTSLTNDSKHATKDEAQMQDTENASNNAAQEDIRSTDLVNVTSLTNDVESLKIGDDQTNCSTPLTIRHRASPGGITSPPGFLHRFSTLSSFNIFPVRSPMLDSNPNLKKRFDSKKTPDKMIALSTATPMEASPLATKMWMSPNQSNPNVGENKRGGDESPDDTSHAGVSPRIMITSSSFISSPDNGGKMLSAARSNLFPSNTNEQGNNFLHKQFDSHHAQHSGGDIFHNQADLCMDIRYHHMFFPQYKKNFSI